MLNPYSLYARTMRLSWQGRAALILLITLLAMWFLAQGIQHGLETSVAWMMPAPERPNGCIDILQETDHPAYSRCVWLAQERIELWQRFGRWLTAYGGFLVALFLHSVIGSPMAYSYLGRFALVLLILGLPTLFGGIVTCLGGSFYACFLPVALLTLTVYTIHHHRTDRLYIGDWVALGMFIVQGICFHIYFEAWWRVFGD